MTLIKRISTDKIRVNLPAGRKVFQIRVIRVLIFHFVQFLTSWRLSGE